MQLILKRNQRTAGMLGNKILFGLDAKVDLTADERDNVNKYNLGSLVIYDSEARQKNAALAAAHGESIGDGRGIGRSLIGFAASAARAAAAALSLRVTIDSLANGQHIECNNLDELLGAEDAIRQACATCRGYLDTAATFDGREEVVEF